MFRSKSPSSKDTSSKSGDVKSDALKQSNERKETIPVDVSKIESICYKKCIYSLDAPSLSYAEKNCLDRCAYKFKETIDYGHNLLLYINYKISNKKLNITKKHNPMHHRFLKLFSTKKNKRPYADPNQSMIDVISDAGSFNDSFRSVQPSLGETSFTDLNHPARQLTETSPNLADYPLNTSSSRANISSVFNIPKKTNLMEDLYGILQEHVVDQLGEMIQQSKRHHSEVKLLEKIQARDFEVYIARLKNAYEKYRKINAARLQKSKGTEKVNVHETLLKCYHYVPIQYFEEDFFFNFEYLTQNRAKIFSTQEDLGDFLDNVEVNLYYQISDKFQAFLDVILKLNQMEAQIENSLYSVKYLRNFNHKLKTDCSNQIERTLRLKRRKINIEKTLGLIGLISVVKKTLPTLVQLIQRNNIESAVKLIKTSEDTYKNKLKQVKSLRNFNTSFNDARATLERMLTSEFEDRCISYLAPTLNYNKTSHPNVSMEISMAEESFVVNRL